MTLHAYASRQMVGLIARVSEEIAHLAHARDAEAIHDLRVAIRRMTQSLRAFAGVLPKKQSKLVRREAKTLMDLAAEVRSRDIALELFEAAGVTADTAPCVRLMLERQEAIDRLAAAAAEWRHSGFEQRWRQSLELP